MIIPENQASDGTKHLGCVVDRNFCLREPDKAPKNARHWIILNDGDLENAQKL